MPYKKKFNKKKGYKKKGYKTSKKAKFSMVKQLNYNGFHCFKEKFMTTFPLTCDGNGDCAFTTGVGTGWSSPVYQFKLNQLGDVTHYQNMFDQYRITGIKMKIFPNSTVSGTVASTTGTDGTGTVATAFLPQPIPKLWYTYDADDSGNPASVLALFEKDVKTRTFNRDITIYIKNPCALSTTTKDPSSIVDVSNMVRRPIKSPWINTSDPDVGHLGIEWGLFGAQATQRYNPRVVLTYYFQCKGNN